MTCSSYTNSCIQCNTVTKTWRGAAAAAPTAVGIRVLHAKLTRTWHAASAATATVMYSMQDRFYMHNDQQVLQWHA